jgi:hypothetical protein
MVLAGVAATSAAIAEACSMGAVFSALSSGDIPPPVRQVLRIDEQVRSIRMAAAAGRTVRAPGKKRTLH